MRKCSEEQHTRQHTQTARHACHVGASAVWGGGPSGEPDQSLIQLRTACTAGPLSAREEPR